MMQLEMKRNLKVNSIEMDAVGRSFYLISIKMDGRIHEHPAWNTIFRGIDTYSFLRNNSLYYSGGLKGMMKW